MPRQGSSARKRQLHLLKTPNRREKYLVRAHLRRWPSAPQPHWRAVRVDLEGRLVSVRSQTGAWTANFKEAGIFLRNELKKDPEVKLELDQTIILVRL